MNSCCNLLRSFSQNPATRVAWPVLHLKDDVEKAVEAGRGRSHYPLSFPVSYSP